MEMQIVRARGGGVFLALRNQNEMLGTNKYMHVCTAVHVWDSAAERESSEVIVVITIRAGIFWAKEGA
jgi:hypothetical protein